MLDEGRLPLAPRAAIVLAGVALVVALGTGARADTDGAQLAPSTRAALVNRDVNGRRWAVVRHADGVINGTTTHAGDEPTVVSCTVFLKLAETYACQTAEPCTTDDGRSIQRLPDGERVVVSAAIAGERWVVVREADGSVSGSVQGGDGALRFLSCKPGSDGLECTRASACQPDTCPPHEPADAGPLVPSFFEVPAACPSSFGATETVGFPAGFFQPGATSPIRGDFDYGTLTALADAYGTDKGSLKHGYTEIYEYFFRPVRETTERILEIGVARGAGMRALADYFPKAKLVGIDIADVSELDSDRIATMVADQASREDLQRLLDTHGGDYDIVIDDGGHSMEQQQISFGVLFPHVTPGGFYVIEDVHTSLFNVAGSKYGATEDGRGTTFSMFVDYVTEKKIVSTHMTDAEAAYATANIEYASLYVARESESIAWIIKKKGAAD